MPMITMAHASSLAGNCPVPSIPHLYISTSGAIGLRYMRKWYFGGTCDIG